MRQFLAGLVLLLPTLASAAITDWTCTRVGTAMGIPYYMAFGTCSTAAGGAATAGGDALAQFTTMSGMANTLCGSGSLVLKSLVLSPVMGAVSPDTTVWAVPAFDYVTWTGSTPSFKLQLLGGNVANGSLLSMTTSVAAATNFTFFALCQ